MNDYHLDPPDYPEAPECPFCDEGVAGSCEQSNGRITYTCDMIECGHQWSVDDPGDPDPQWEDIEIFDSSPIEEVNCPHNRPLGSCDHCDYLSDIAYDAARENRLFGR